MSQLSFAMPDGSIESVEVAALLNAGYAGRNQAEVASHIAELEALGVPAPSTTPALYPISPYLAQQTDRVYVQHGKTSGEAEWALIITDDDVLITVACDHTDRDLERRSRLDGLDGGATGQRREAGTLEAAGPREQLEAVRIEAFPAVGSHRGGDAERADAGVDRSERG